MSQHVGHRHSDEIAQLNTKIERLRSDKELLEAGVREMASMIDDLRARNAELSQHAEDFHHDICAENDNLKTDNERLRARNAELEALLTDAPVLIIDEAVARSCCDDLALAYMYKMREWHPKARAALTKAEEQK